MEYIGAAGDIPFSEIKIDVWPKYQGMVARLSGGQNTLDTMQWGVPLTIKGKRPGTTITKRINNVRNLSSPFWRSMLTKAENRCLVPFTKFAEPKAQVGAGGMLVRGQRIDRLGVRWYLAPLR